MKSYALKQTSFYTQLTIKAECISVYWAQDARLGKNVHACISISKSGGGGGGGV